MVIRADGLMGLKILHPMAAPAGTRVDLLTLFGSTQLFRLHNHFGERTSQGGGYCFAGFQVGAALAAFEQANVGAALIGETFSARSVRAWCWAGRDPIHGMGF
jgi:hypothetical protein